MASCPSTFLKALIKASRGSLPGGSARSSASTTSCIFASQYLVSFSPPWPSYTAYSPQQSSPFRAVPNNGSMILWPSSMYG
eukprot:CAMPEP_0198571436 /NCGR_PEP_ID=MMETSP1462-20131121/110507_1 /TAXON_ID=1333877 /ORGANISM="Brandtodinium nutriculum, Strain RCC3387" /LENGTH=80 /DNA_ID=CAMNT_0044302577 /DNA_START=9 /DNA_END=248 /DNA_ORIENTATION=-